MNRKKLGQERLGAPIMATFEAIVCAVDGKPWPDFQREHVGNYFSNMIGSWLLKLMDGALSDQKLDAVSKEDVIAITLLLFRDMFRHSSLILRPDSKDPSWVEDLFLEVAVELELSTDRLKDDGKAYELEEMANCGWARTLAAPFGLPAEKLFVCHSAIVTGIRDGAE